MDPMENQDEAMVPKETNKRTFGQLAEAEEDEEEDLVEYATVECFGFEELIARFKKEKAETVAEELPYGNPGWRPFDFQVDPQLGRFVLGMRRSVLRHWSDSLQPEEKKMIENLKHPTHALEILCNEWKGMKLEEKTRPNMIKLLDKAFGDCDTLAEEAEERIQDQRLQMGELRLAALEWPKKGPDEDDLDFMGRVRRERGWLVAEAEAYCSDLSTEIHIKP